MWLTGLRISRSEPWLFYLLQVDSPLKPPVPQFPVCKIGKTTIPRSLTINEEDGEGEKSRKKLSVMLDASPATLKYAEHTHVCLILVICFVCACVFCLFLFLRQGLPHPQMAFTLLCNQG